MCGVASFIVEKELKIREIGNFRGVDCAAQEVNLRIGFVVLTDASSSYSSGIPSNLPPTLISQVKPYILTSDISLLSYALQILTLLLERAPAATFPVIEKDVLSEVYIIAHSSLVSGAALDSLMTFFGALVHADNQIAAHIVPNLVISVEKAPNKSEASPSNVAKCIGVVVKNHQGVAAGTIAEYSKNVKVC